MKKIFVIVTALVSAFLPSSCNKEQSAVDETITTSPELKTYTLTIEASKAPSTKQLVLDGSGNTLNAVWGKDDAVEVYKGSTHLGTLKPVATGSASAVLTGALEGDISVDDWIDLVLKGDFANQDGTLEGVADWTKAWFQVKSIDENKVIVPKDNDDCVNDGVVSFKNWTAIVRFNLKKKSDDSSLSASRMVIKTTSRGLEGSTNNMLTVTPGSSATTFYVGVANLNNGTAATDNYEIFVNTSDGVYSCTATGKTFSQGIFYDVTLKMSTHAYRLAGSPASVFTTAWSTDESANDLGYDSASGLYKITYAAVPGDVANISLQALTDKNYPGVSDYVVSNSATGYSKTLTVTYDPVTATIAHTLTQNTSPYKLYVKDEELAAATSTKWGSSRSVWGEYDFIQLDDVDGKKCFSIPHAIVDGSAHDIYYKGENGCEVKLPSFTSTSATDYNYKTDGFEIVPSYDSYTSEKRIYVQFSPKNDTEGAKGIHAHMWQDGAENATDWNNCQMTTDYAKYDGKYWYYSEILSDANKLIISWNNRSTDDYDRVSYDIEASKNQYYYVSYDWSKETYVKGPLFTSGWTE